MKPVVIDILSFVHNILYIDRELRDRHNELRRKETHDKTCIDMSE